MPTGGYRLLASERNQEIEKSSIKPDNHDQQKNEDQKKKMNRLRTRSEICMAEIRRRNTKERENVEWAKRFSKQGLGANESSE
jgi:hypothetical protein